MEETPYNTLKHCLPDCSTTVYHGSVTAAPFKKCNMKNLEVSFMCSFESGMNPPIWGEMVSDQYMKEVKSVPKYIEDQVHSNLRNHIGTETYSLQLYSSKMWLSFSFHTLAGDIKGIPVFPASLEKNPKYDAYAKDIAMVTFFFESSTLFEYKREERMTLIQYISQMGGLLGLCIGFSLISGVEIIYWFTIRLFRNIWNKTH